MFSSRGLFQGLACPNKESCNRPHCLFSHAKDIPPPPSLSIPVDTPKANSSIIKPSIASTSAIKTVSVKRPIAHSPVPGSGVEVRNGSSSGEPPRKLQKLASLQKQAVPNTSYTSVSAILLLYFSLNYNKVTDGSSYSQSQCGPISDCCASSSGNIDRPPCLCYLS